MKFIAHKSKSTPKVFLKLNSGESVIGVFRGDPEVYFQVYEDGKYKRVPESDPAGQFRFAVNFIVKENGALVSKLFQGNWHDYEALKALNGEFELEETYVKVSQTGERQTKRISFMPMTKAKPNPEQLKNVSLQKLEPKRPTNISYSGPEEMPQDESPIFDEDLPPDF